MINFKEYPEDKPISFYDLPPQERAARMEKAAERGGVENFFDLPPDERARVYNHED